MPYANKEEYLKYHREYYKKHRENMLLQQKNKEQENYKNFPWLRALNSIRARCTNKKTSYFKLGIKPLISKEELQFLWFRDKAYLLSQPSIDRIDGNGNYTLRNCRYIELSVNLNRRKVKHAI